MEDSPLVNPNSRKTSVVNQQQQQLQTYLNCLHNNLPIFFGQPSNTTAASIVSANPNSSINIASPSRQQTMVQSSPNSQPKLNQKILPSKNLSESIQADLKRLMEKDEELALLLKECKIPDL